MKEGSNVHRSLESIMRKELSRDRHYTDIKSLCAVCCVQCDIYPMYNACANLESPAVIGQGDGIYTVGIYRDNDEICTLHYAISLAIMERDSQTPGYLKKHSDENGYIKLDVTILRESNILFGLINEFVQRVA